MMTDQAIYKIDLHTHSTLSYDGGISDLEYEKALESGLLDFVAITDHNDVEFALKLNKKHGEKIIVGEEIRTGEGEIIGLFLKKKIEPYQGFEKTLALIKNQGAITYLPHPFDTRRHGVKEELAEKFIQKLDIIEIFNARTITPGTNKSAAHYGEKENKPFSAGSDSHSIWELGRTFTITQEKPTKDNLTEILKRPKLETHLVTLKGFMSTKWNKIKKWTS